MDSFQSRAGRFELQLIVRYRVRGQNVWREGCTKDVSPTGVFFWADRLIEVGSSVEMRLEVVRGPGGEVLEEMICYGKVVRSVSPTATNRRYGLAARVLDCHFVQSLVGASSAADTGVSDAPLDPPWARGTRST